jgi:uncharacterized protein YegP (UPF0339 family)
MAKQRDKTEVPKLTPYRRGRRDKATSVNRGKKLRILEVLPDITGEYYWRCLSENNEIVYVSQSFNSKSAAKEAAAREHEGRGGHYGYVLKWTDERSGEVKRETL